MNIFVSGWLTSVPHQATRAYCKYCKKDLHAHRLSLLKHTCTMKHQRAALMVNSNEKTENPQTQQTEDNDDESEYVVERLDLDEDILDTQQPKLETEPSEVNVETEEKESGNICLRLDLSDEEEHKPVIKKIELPEVRLIAYYSCVLFYLMKMSISRF